MLVIRPEAYSLLLRPLLFSLPPERAQKVADLALKQRPIWRALSPLFQVRDARLEVELSGIRLKSPVGLAAGYDKDCELLPSLARLGFGYLVGGTVVESPRPGNPRPRIVRYTREQSLVNALGFPSRGLEYAARRLERARQECGDTRIFVSVSGVSEDEVLRCHGRLEPLADAVEVNISSPNTAGLRVFHEPKALGGLLARLNQQRRKPIFVKLPPYAADDSEARDRVLALVRMCLEQGVDALTVANTRPTRDPRLAVGAGGLSGRLVFPDMLRMVREVRAEVGNRLAINACGGIFSAEDAWQALQAGAATVQLLTGLVYRGPGIARSINRGLLDIMDRQGAQQRQAAGQD